MKHLIDQTSFCMLKIFLSATKGPNGKTEANKDQKIVV